MKYCKKYNKTHHYLPIFGMNMNFVFNHDDFNYLCKQYQDYEADRSLSNNGECFMNPENGEVVIGIFNNSISTIVHEATHATLFILESRFMNPFDSNGEAMAYIQAHLFDEINKRMIKYHKKVKNASK